MANEIVKYRNQINKISLRNFNSKELDIFMEICSRMRNKGSESITFDFWYLKQLIGWKDNTSDSFDNLLKSTYDKLIQCNFSYEDQHKYIKFVLFNEYEIDYKEQTVKVGVHKKFEMLLNFIIGDKNYTRFELEEFVSFKSTYTKEFFRRMKQFNLGFWEVDLQEFKDLLDIPKTYNSSAIDKWVLKPIKEELEKKYNLKITKKYNRKSLRGRPSLIGYRFDFKVIQDNSASENPIETIKDYQIGKYNFKKYIENDTWLLITSKKNKDYESLTKIIDIYLQNGKIKMDMNGGFTDKIQTHTFENETHLMNFIEKFRYKK